MKEREKTRVLNNLKTARGQLDAILRMVDEDRYCVDISKQILAVQSLLKKSNMTILHQHTLGCVKEAIEQGKGDEKLEEIFYIIEKYAR